jgi:hypothetical protein
MKDMNCSLCPTVRIAVVIDILSFYGSKTENELSATVNFCTRESMQNLCHKSSSDGIYMTCQKQGLYSKKTKRAIFRSTLHLFVILRKSLICMIDEQRKGMCRLVRITPLRFTHSFSPLPFLLLPYLPLAS